MKTSKNIFTAFTIIILFVSLTSSSNLFADGAPIPPFISTRNAEINGLPISFGCGQFANFSVNSQLEFDILIDVYNEHASINYFFNPSPPPGTPVFTPPVPLNVVQGFYSYHFNWISTAQYYGSLNIIVDDGINPPVTCILNFDVALPVELSSFSGMVHDNNVRLNWSTSSETNNSGFEIERSNVFNQTSNKWTKISFVRGSGTASSPVYYEFTDRNLSSGKFNYRLKQIDYNGNFEYFNLGNEVEIGVPEKFELSQNYPNPFNPSTKISYSLPFDGKVSLTIFDVSGKEIMNLINDSKSAGYYEEVVNGIRLSSGVYFYRLTLAGNGMTFTSAKKMLLTK